MEELDTRLKGSRWLSMLSVLLAARIEPLQVVLCEQAETGEWDFAFWHYDPDGFACAFRCGQNMSIWLPVETPSYSGSVRPWDDPDVSRNIDTESI